LCCVAVGVVNKLSSQTTSASGGQLKNVKVNGKTSVNGLSVQQSTNGTVDDSESAATAGELLHSTTSAAICITTS